MAPGDHHPVLAFTSILCIAVGGGASGALNMWYESRYRRADVAHRQPPDPRGRVTRPEALTFGLMLAFFSVMTLGILVNLLAGALLAFTIFFYVVIYTIGLKRWTAQNIVIGGAAGALPPVVAWAAAYRLAVDGAGAAVPRSSSSGPRRISGRWRCSATTTTPAPACRCCRWSPVPMRPGCRSCSTPSCWSRPPSRHGRSAISPPSTAWPRWSSAPA